MNLSIGLSGLKVAQRAIEIVGTNIANAGTDGYHRQDPKIVNMVLDTGWDSAIAGSRIESVRRSYDLLLERELTYEQPRYGQITQELETLRSVENILSEPGAGGLTTALNEYFSALRDLSAEPHSRPYREQVIHAAQTLVGQFRTFANFLDEMDQHILVQAENYAVTINDLGGEIARLNGEIETLELAGRNTNMLQDRRDQAINELAELADIRVEQQKVRVDLMNVTAWGVPLVIGSNSTSLEVGLNGDEKLGVATEGTNRYQIDVGGGRLGGLIQSKNGILADIRSSLDTLAGDVISQINRLHVQGLGTSGSFTQLVGVTRNTTQTLEEWNAGVIDGTFHIRSISAAGAVEQFSVAVDADTDTLLTVRDKINALATVNLEAEVVNQQLRIRSLNDFKFDFLPTALIDTSALTGGAIPTVITSGTYSGSSNEDYTFTVVSPGGVGTSGDIGITDDLELTVTDSLGQVVARLNVGLGYAAGDFMDIGNGLSVSLSTGTLNHDETFAISALADSDSAYFLAAAGMNTFFQGNSALDIALRDEISADPGRIATARGEEMLDNFNILRMSEAGESRSAALGNMAPVEYYRQMVTSIGQNVAIRRARKESIDTILHQLTNQRDEVSGVDLNDEAAKLLVFQQMYQAVAKFVSVQDQAMQVLIDML